MILSKDRGISVLHIFSGDLWAGAEVMVYNLLKELNSEPAINISAICLNYGMLSNKMKDLGIDTTVIPETNTSLISIYTKAMQFVKRIRPNIIHAHRYKENLLGLLLAKTCNVNTLISTVHGLTEQSTFHPQHLALKAKGNYALLKAYFNTVIAVSQEMQRVLFERHGFKKSQIQVIYNGIAPQSCESLYKRTSFPDNALHIGSVGRLVPVKGYDFFLSMAADLLKKNNRVRFSLLGDGPLKERLQAHAEKLNVADRITFRAHRADTITYYRSLDLYVNTSLHEGMPLSILEAMSCGLPIVAPNVGGIPEVVRHHKEGLLLNQRRAELFSAACLDLLADQRLRARLGANAAARVSAQFTSARMAEEYKKIYAMG